jgi:hypothetical protein
MRRFALWRNGQPAVWRRTAPRGRSRRGSVITPTAAVLPDADSQLSDGVVVEARLKARLLGAPVLRVDGVVLVSPGRLVEPTRVDVVSRAAPARDGSPRGAPGESLARAGRLLADNDADIERWHTG